VLVLDLVHEWILGSLPWLCAVHANTFLTLVPITQHACSAPITCDCRLIVTPYYLGPISTDEYGRRWVSQKMDSYGVGICLLEVALGATAADILILEPPSIATTAHSSLPLTWMLLRTLAGLGKEDAGLLLTSGGEGTPEEYYQSVVECMATQAGGWDKLHADMSAASQAALRELLAVFTKLAGAGVGGHRMLLLVLVASRLIHSEQPLAEVLDEFRSTLEEGAAGDDSESLVVMHTPAAVPAAVDHILQLLKHNPSINAELRARGQGEELAALFKARAAAKAAAAAAVAGSQVGGLVASVVGRAGDSNKAAQCECSAVAAKVGRSAAGVRINTNSMLGEGGEHSKQAPNLVKSANGVEMAAVKMTSTALVAARSKLPSVEGSTSGMMDKSHDVQVSFRVAE
jgi:hypothetical protein